MFHKSGRSIKRHLADHHGHRLAAAVTSCTVNDTNGTNGSTCKIFEIQSDHFIKRVKRLANRRTKEFTRNFLGEREL